VDRGVFILKQVCIMISINNKVFRIVCYLHENHLFVCNFHIKRKYQHKRLSYPIFQYLLLKYHKPIVLECYHSLYNYYINLGFIKIGDIGDGYYVMQRII